MISSKYLNMNPNLNFKSHILQKLIDENSNTYLKSDKKVHKPTRQKAKLFIRYCDSAHLVKYLE